MLVIDWSEMTLNYRMMVERYPILKELVGGSNSNCEISSLPDGNLPGDQLPPMLWRWPVGLLSQRKKEDLSIIDTQTFHM
jgi:hypothetical protein